MSMLLYAVRSLRNQRSRYASTAVVLFAGLTLVLAFVCLLASSADASTSADRRFLLLFPAILGSWILAISLFAIASTASVVTQSRGSEFDTLRRLGAFGSQIRLLVSIETAVVGVVVAIPAIVAGPVLGSIIFDRLHGIGILAASTHYAPGIVAPGLAVVMLIVVSGVAAQFGSRSAPTRRRSVARRRIVATIMLGAGIASSTAAFAVEADGAAATATAGPGAVLVSIGLSLLAREILDAFLWAASVLATGKSGVSAYLAAINARAVDGVRPTTMFFTLFVGVSVGTLTMQGIENSSAGVSSQGRLMASINYSVVGLVAAFMAIALLNNLIASVGRRRNELAAMFRIGAMPRQTIRMLLIESSVAVFVAGVAGTIGAFVAVAPFAYVKGGNPFAAASPVIIACVVAAGAVLTLGVTLFAGRTVVAAAT